MFKFDVILVGHDIVTHWRWQGYHLQTQIQNPMLTNKSIENEGLSENMGFNGKQFDDSGQ